MKYPRPPYWINLNSELLSKTYIVPVDVYSEAAWNVMVQDEYVLVPVVVDRKTTLWSGRFSRRIKTYSRLHCKCKECKKEKRSGRRLKVLLAAKDFTDQEIDKDWQSLLKFTSALTPRGAT